MPLKKHLDPRAQAAVQHLRVYAPDWYGAIRPRLLTAALPPRGPKRGWRDSVTHAVLEEIISVHRPNNHGEVFFDGPLYRVVRRDLAQRYCTSPDEVSSALTWLEALGVIGREERTLLDEDGQPRGKQVFAYPIMSALQELLDTYKATGKTPKPFSVTPQRGRLTSPKNQVGSAKEAGSPPGRTGDSLNCAQAQQKHAESVGEASAQRHERVAQDDRLRRAEDGGGEADDHKAQVPHLPPAAPPRSADGARSNPARQAAPGPPARARGPGKPGSGGHGSTPASPCWTPPVPPAEIKLEDEAKMKAWEEGARLCALWGQAITRRNYVVTCTPTIHDHQIAYKFFLTNPQTKALYTIAVAIDAWSLTREPNRKGFDDLYHVRASLELRAFVQSLGSGKLESEVGRYLTINCWADLRACFTQSELLYYGWPSSIPVIGLPLDEVWENDPGAPRYYLRRKLPLPPEVAEADDRRRELELMTKH